MSRPSWFTVLGIAAAAALVACGGASPTAPSPVGSSTRLTAVVPTGGATGVDPSAPIAVSFSHAMHSGAERYVSLHEGTATGTSVSGAATWSADSMMLTFMPNAPLKAQTTYAIHMGGNMMDNRGGAVDVSTGMQFGGQMATSQMMSGGMMGGTEMGSGWQTPGSNTYGMVFTFTTH